MANLSVEERKAIMNEIERKLQNQSISLGEAVKAIRVELYQMTQTQYAKFIKISDKTLRDIEKGNTDPRCSVINKVLKPGGFQLSARRYERKVGQ